MYTFSDVSRMEYIKKLFEEKKGKRFRVTAKTLHGRITYIMREV